MRPEVRRINAARSTLPSDHEWEVVAVHVGTRMVPFWSGFTLLRHDPSQEAFGSEYELISQRKDYSCHVESLCRLQHPSLASCLLRLFQRTPSLEEAVAVVALALASIT